jgi:hypothetical protein
MNLIEWQREAESAITSPEIADVRPALYVHLQEQFGVFRAAPDEVNFLTEPFHNRGVSAIDAQSLNAHKPLQSIHERFSWTSRNFEDRLNVVCHGPRPLAEFIDKLLSVTQPAAKSRLDWDVRECRSGNRVALNGGIFASR